MYTQIRNVFVSPYFLSLFFPSNCKKNEYYRKYGKHKKVERGKDQLSPTNVTV